MTILSFLTLFDLTCGVFRGIIKKMTGLSIIKKIVNKTMTNNTQTTEKYPYINTDFAGICSALSQQTADKFRIFAKNIYGLKCRAELNTDKENLTTRISEATKNYISSPVFESVSDKIKKEMEQYFSALLGVSLPEKTTPPNTTSASTSAKSTTIILPGYNDSEETEKNPYVETKEETDTGFAIVNTIILRGATVLMCKRGEEWSLPGGNVRYGENPRVAAARHVSDMSRITVIESNLKYINSYENNDSSPMLVINYMYAPKTKPTAISTGSVDKSEFVEFDKVFALKLRDGDEKILRTFIIR